MTKIKILFLASNPHTTNQLKLDEEVRGITEKLRASEHRDLLELVSVWAVRPDDLLQALNLHKPDIVHFSGHGNSAGEIILTDNYSAPIAVSPKAINALFRTLKDNVRLVILNACYSRLQANAITEVIDCVIGMNTAIGDIAAITFAASIYRAIGFGRSIQEAFEQGVTALLLEGIPEENTPELLVRKDVDSSLIFLIKTPDSLTKVVSHSKLYLDVDYGIKIISPKDDDTVGEYIEVSGIYSIIPPPGTLRLFTTNRKGNESHERQEGYWPHEIVKDFSPETKTWRARVNIHNDPADNQWGIIVAVVGQSTIALWNYYYKVGPIIGWWGFEDWPKDDTQICHRIRVLRI